jgi:hypothetical protein
LPPSNRVAAIGRLATLRRLEERVRELERLLRRETMEVEILKEALDLERQNQAAVALAAAGISPVKIVTATLGMGALECHRAAQRRTVAQSPQFGLFGYGQDGYGYE